MTGLHTILTTEPLCSDISFGWVLFQKDTTLWVSPVTDGGDNLGEKIPTGTICGSPMLCPIPLPPAQSVLFE